MRTALLTAALVIFFAIPAEAHAMKRNCLWAGKNIFRTHMMCSDGNSQPRATPSRSVTPVDPPDKPDYGCKGDDKGKGHGKDKD